VSETREREIKFRVWDPDKQRMVYYRTPICKEGMGLFMLDSEWPHDWIDTLVAFMTRPKYLMQYTGLKDKNGKEIYEGDVVVNRCDEMWVVEYITRRLRHTLGHGEYADPVEMGYFPPMHTTEGLEVIGNIYENPEIKEGE